MDKVVFACWEHWKMLPKRLQRDTLPGSYGHWEEAEDWLYRNATLGSQ